jgi:hypothetical protein
MTEVLVRLGVCQSSLIVVRPRVGFGLLHKNHNNCSSIIHCSTRLSKLPSSWGFGVSWDLQRQCLLTAGAVSSDPLKSSTVLTFDSIQPDMSTGGGDGDGFGDNGGGGGGGGGDNNKGDDEGGSDENSKKTASMSMSQKLTLAYAALVGGTNKITLYLLMFCFCSHINLNREFKKVQGFVLDLNPGRTRYLVT